MGQGRDVLIVYDDLTHHERAYRKLSLLLCWPPGGAKLTLEISFISTRDCWSGQPTCAENSVAGL